MDFYKMHNFTHIVDNLYFIEMIFYRLGLFYIVNISCSKVAELKEVEL
jgi:hypothetical protein